MSAKTESQQDAREAGSAPIYHNYSGGQWVKAQGGETFSSFNPANASEVIGKFALSSPEDVKQAVDAAERAFPSWRRTPAPARAELLMRLGRILEKRKDEMARMMVREMGKVIKEARGDVQEAIDMAYYMAGEGRRLFGHTVPSELPDKFAMAIRQPIGVVGVITPWNFPVAI